MSGNIVVTVFYAMVVDMVVDRFPASQPKREMERSLEALNQLSILESEDTTKRSACRLSDGSHKEALVFVH